MAMPLVAPRYTIADLDRFPDDGNRYELVGGALLVTQAPGARHQSVLSRLTMEIGLYLHRETLAFAVTPGVIRVGDDTQLEPDLLVIPERYRNVDWVKVTDWWLAVEVSGAPSRVYDRDFKRPVYLDVGVRECGGSISRIRRSLCPVLDSPLRNAAPAGSDGTRRRCPRHWSSRSARSSAETGDRRVTELLPPSTDPMSSPD